MIRGSSNCNLISLHGVIRVDVANLFLGSLHFDNLTNTDLISHIYIFFHAAFGNVY
jgi:hypothetical protein